MPFFLLWHGARLLHATRRLVAMFLFPAWAFFCTVEAAAAAMPGQAVPCGLAVIAYAQDEPENSGNGQSVPDDSADAAAAISGSPWPGVIDHLLQRPLPGENTSQPNVHINYPSVGNRDVDTDIRTWVGDIATAFEEHLDFASSLDSPSIDDKNDFGVFLQDDDLNSEDAIRGARADNLFELWGNYTVSRPSDAAVSITFEIWNYTGGGQGNLDIITLNYSLLNGQRLTFVDIFEKPEMALELMSSWARRQLEPRLGASRRAQMLGDGTLPLVENFSSLTLTPTGLCINFQPYQVAPGEAGIQKVEMPLEELRDAGPLLALWGK